MERPRKGSRLDAAQRYALCKYASEGEDGVRRALQLLNEIQEQGIPVNMHLLNIMIRRCASTGNPIGAEHLLAWIRRDGRVPTVNSYCGVVLAWAKVGRFRETEEWIRRLSCAGISTPKKICRPIMHALMSAIPPGPEGLPFVGFASDWLARAHSLGVPMDRRTVNVMMSAYARYGDLPQTERWFTFLMATGIEPNQTTLSALVTAATLSGNEAREQYWLAQMRNYGFEPGPLVLASPELLNEDAAEDLSDTASDHIRELANERALPSSTASSSRGPRLSLSAVISLFGVPGDPRD